MTRSAEVSTLYVLRGRSKIGKFMKQKKAKINYIEVHARVENNKRKQSPGQSLLRRLGVGNEGVITQIHLAMRKTKRDTE